MKNIVSVLFAAFFISNFACAQTNDPNPYCTAEYHNEPSSNNLRIKKVKLNSLDNETFGGDYIYYTNEDTTELVLGETYTITIETGSFSSAHSLAAWIDFDGNGTFDATDELGAIVTPTDVEEVNTFIFTVPLGGFELTTRLRVRVIEDELYYVTNSGTTGGPCNSPYEYTLGGGGTTNEFAYGETEDYVVDIVSVSSEETTVDVYSGGFNVIWQNGATLQFYADVLPSFLSQAVTWSVLEGTGSAYITVDGLLVPLANGTVTVLATSSIDGVDVTGAVNVNILNQEDIVTMSTEDDNENLCTSQQTSYTVDVEISDNVNQNVFFSTSQLPGGTFSQITPPFLTSSGTVSVSVSNSNAAPSEGIFYLIANVPGSTFSDTLELQLSTYTSDPVTPFINEPQDEEGNVPTFATFEWFTAFNAYTYDLQVATDEDFDNIVIDQNELFGTSYTLETALDVSTNYYWRMRSVNGCGATAWSFVFMFTTIPNTYVLGCMDASANNYNPLAQLEDGSCTYPVVGCSDTLALNYIETLDSEDSTICEYIALIDSTVLNDSTFHFEVVSDIGPINGISWEFGDDSPLVWSSYPDHIYDENGIYIVTATLYTDNTIIAPDGILTLFMTINFQANGCTDPYAYNYDLGSSIDDGTCVAAVLGCMNPLSVNYNSSANVDDGSCVAVVFGCTDEDAFNYDPTATIDNGSCVAVVEGCTDETAFNYNSLANTDDGSCEAVIEGCTIESAFNYNENANTDDGSCIPTLFGCIDEDALNYNALANTDDGSCEYPIATSPSWTVSANSENHTILIPTTADITVQGYDIVIGDYIGVFYTDDNDDLVCGGMLEWTGLTTTLTAYGTEDNLDNGFVSNETFTWMVWDATDGLDHEAEVSYDLTMPNTGDYSDDGISSVLSLSTEITQTISLSIGWSLVSTNLNPSNEVMDSVLASISEDIFLAKDENGDVFWPEFGINNIGDHTIGKAYKVKMDAAADLVISGTSVDPTSIELSLPEGWSYLGYLRKQSANVSSALASISSDIFIVKNGMGDVYWPAFNINGIGNMNPGEGYQIKMNNSVEFNYPSNDLILALARLSAKVNPINTPTLTSNNMTIGVPLNAWDILPVKGTEVLVLNEGGQVVGSSVFQDENLVISVFGSDQDVHSIDEEEVYHFALLTDGGEMVKVSDVQFEFGSTNYKTDDVQMVSRMSIDFDTNDWEVVSLNKSELVVSFNYDEAINLSVELRDLSGRILYQSPKYLVKDGEVELSIPNLPVGQYILTNIGAEKVSTKMIHLK